MGTQAAQLGQLAKGEGRIPEGSSPELPLQRLEQGLQRLILHRRRHPLGTALATLPHGVLLGQTGVGQHQQQQIGGDGGLQIHR